MIKIVSTKENGPIIAGKLILTVAVIISIIPYGYFFSWLFFISGIIFIWSGNLDKKQKWYWTILPLIVWYPLMILTFFIITLLSN